MGDLKCGAIDCPNQAFFHCINCTDDLCEDHKKSTHVTKKSQTHKWVRISDKSGASEIICGVATSYKLENRLGSRGYAEFFRITPLYGGPDLVIKHFHTPPERKQQEIEQMVRDEIVKMRKQQECPHKNIIRLVDVIDHPSGIPELILDLYHMSLHSFLVHHTDIQGRPILAPCHLIGLLHALEYLHSIGFVHGDIQSNNVLLRLDQSGIRDIVWCNFNVPIRWQDLQGSALTSRFRAPEIDPHNPSYNKFTDAYSFGAMMYEMCSPDHLPPDCMRWTFPSLEETVYTDALKDLIAQTLISNPNKRISIPKMQDKIVQVDSKMKYPSMVKIRDVESVGSAIIDTKQKNFFARLLSFEPKRDQHDAISFQVMPCQQDGCTSPSLYHIFEIAGKVTSMRMELLCSNRTQDASVSFRIFHGPNVIAHDGPHALIPKRNASYDLEESFFRRAQIGDFIEISFTCGKNLDIRHCRGAFRGDPKCIVHAHCRRHPFDICLKRNTSVPFLFSLGSTFFSCVVPYLSIGDMARLQVSTLMRDWIQERGWHSRLQAYRIEHSIVHPETEPCPKCSLQHYSAIFWDENLRSSPSIIIQNSMVHLPIDGPQNITQTPTIRGYTRRKIQMHNPMWEIAVIPIGIKLQHLRVAYQCASYSISTTSTSPAHVDLRSLYEYFKPPMITITVDQHILRYSVISKSKKLITDPV
eukprot:TRINITY_DN8157_c0_g1_i3.p1 TRINITY_DN8157_c0_g1~~TRINITY_DN8157_c0_g1_i3.p1  ORF type:complete len:697 (+),score=93.87 TRINITY_DN8157_c0_g1_i3:97-2187(+)